MAPFINVSWGRHWRLFALLSVTAAASVACRAASPKPTAIDAVLAAIDGLPRAQRPLPVRIFGTATHRPWRELRSSAGDDATDKASDLIAVLAGSGASSSHDDKTAAYVLGLAALGAGRADLAVEQLSTALVDHPNDSVLVAHLAEAHLARGGDPRDLPRALDYLVKSITALGRQPALLFNQALTFDALGLQREAQAAWRDYLAVDSTSAWASEAQERYKRAAARRVAAEWPTALKSFQSAPSPSSAQTLTADYTQFVREYTEWHVPAAWGRAILAEDYHTAARELTQGRMLADQLRDRHHDALAANLLGGIARASSGSRRAIAAGFVDLKKGIDSFSQDRHDEAIPYLEVATRTLRAQHSHGWLWSELHLALIDSYSRRAAVAFVRLDAIRAIAQREGYLGLLGREGWLRGVIAALQSNRPRALEEYRVAIALYEQALDSAGAAAVYNAAANSLRILGDRYSGWGFILGGLRGTDLMPLPLNRYLVFFNASLFSLRDGLDGASVIFQNLALAEARARGTSGSGALAEAFIRRAVIHQTRGDMTSARADLGEAERLLPHITEAALKRYQEAWYRLTLGRFLANSEPLNARRELDSALATLPVFDAAEVPHAWLARGRVDRRLGEHTAAESAFAQGVRAFEANWLRLPEPDLRISYLDESWELFSELVRTAAVEQKDWSKAFRYAESSRARVLGEQLGLTRSAARELDQLESRLPDATGVLSFFALDDRLLWWASRRGGTQHGHIDVKQTELERLTQRLSAALSQGEPAALPLIEEVSSLIWEPLSAVLPHVKSLVIVADVPLHRIPFAALVDRRTGARLVEHVAIASSPSVTTLLASSRRLESLSTSPPRTVLAVGNPALGAVEREHFRDLPEAESEARAVAAMYPRSTLLTRAAATRSAVRSSLASPDVIHLAGHAVANEAYPAVSYFVLTPDEGDASGALFGFELETLRNVHARLAVLGACQTAVGVERRGEGVQSLARPLLAAGIPSVIASLWDVGDVQTRTLLTAFHRHYRALSDPAESLRQAQLEILRSGDHESQRSLMWAAFIAVGGILPPRQLETAK